MRTAVEAVHPIRYMLRCLGVKITYVSLLCGDNMGVIQSCEILDSLLKKKYVSIAFNRPYEPSCSEYESNKVCWLQ